MGEDEAGTLVRLRGHLRELFDPKVAEHKGRVVKTTGDGILIEFPSVVEAVACAVAVQRGMAERNAGTPESQRIVFRVGINLGDVIVEGGDIHGDGVNVAARLEALAQPGGIYVSGMVHDQVHSRLNIDFEDLGEQNLKNIARPVRVYGLQSHTIASLPVPVIGALPKPENGYRRRRLILGISLAVASALIITGTALSVQFIAGGRPNKALITDVGTPAPRLSLVVLPFANLTNDSGQQYWADGITEDLTTDLSQIPGMLVISRGSAFSYKDKHVDLRQIGRELRVRYILEGSIQRTGNQLRINAQLIDAETDQHLWADRFDRELADLFVLQNEITTRIANALRLEVTKAEVARPTQSPDAFDYYLRARAASARPKTREVHAAAIELYERALTLDPDSTIIKSDLASELAGRVLNNLTDSKEADLNRAERLAGEAIAASPSRAEPHFARGQVLRAQGNFAGAIPEYEAVLAVNRNSAYAYSNLGYCKLFTGLIEESIPLSEQFIRLSPRDPIIGFAYVRIGIAHLLKGRLSDAIPWLEKARASLPAHPLIRANLAAAYGLQGDVERARIELAEARRLSRDDRFASVSRLIASQNFGVPEVRALFEATYVSGLRKAGLPED